LGGRKGGGYGPIASAVVRAYNGDLGAEAPTGSRGRASGQRIKETWGLGGEAALLVFGRSMEAANLPTFLQFGNAKK